MSDVNCGIFYFLKLLYYLNLNLRGSTFERLYSKVLPKKKTPGYFTAYLLPLSLSHPMSN